ncbi:hypothetical protein tinsulaeT_19970 [Thalassotalea insulae]|uniref:DUF1285 domain-containing protein n=1 Tax=Thalassotalea insulae TaxID=2056778 RepID=A0ABQ6GRV9_9GAMM|nr:DUF1285 domain-containing protein [Thalassotalea insulae]GLX78657.1 hypothetical protein tinsulaeT_19970 [Thalassotalea insulae]
MALDKLSKQITRLADNEKALPPVELWDPPYCGEIKLTIKSNGDWYYQDTIFKRLSLVKLFASVLKKEADDYFLVTPVEKVKITVEDVPFIITQWQWLDEQQSVMELTTNLGDSFVLNSEHQLSDNEQGALYVNVRHNLRAKVHRNVYYQWVDLAQQEQLADKTVLTFYSDGQCYVLGEVD